PLGALLDDLHLLQLGGVGLLAVALELDDLERAGELLQLLLLFVSQRLLFLLVLVLVFVLLLVLVLVLVFVLLFVLVFVLLFVLVLVLLLLFVLVLLLVVREDETGRVGDDQDAERQQQHQEALHGNLQPEKSNATGISIPGRQEGVNEKAIGC